MNYSEEGLRNLDFNINVSSDTYYNDNGYPVPRVTEILSKMIHNDTLMYWANSLGLKGQRYKTVLTNAANEGTKAHKAIELFLKEKLESRDNLPFLGFLMWYTIIQENTGYQIETVYIEHKLSCEWFGGTLDALIKIGNKLYLVDFKTSNHITYTYFLQLAAYRYMLRIKENIIVDGVIVLQLSKDEPGFNEYILIFEDPAHLDFMNKCENAFLSLVYAFYNIRYIEDAYKNIF